MSDAVIPHHVGVIIDGNRRWAKANGRTAMDGHRKGYQLLKDVADWLFKKGILELSAFVFSTENWNRSKQEVKDLMKLVRWVLKNEAEKMHKKNIRIRITGLRAGVPKDILALIEQVIAKTKNNSGGILNLCFNYGGRADIVNAAKKFVKRSAQDITEASFAKALSTAGLHDVDLIIRTAENRLSNFMLWESAYAELYFLPEKLWPDLTERDFDEALTWFAARQRRFGK